MPTPDPSPRPAGLAAQVRPPHQPPSGAGSAGAASTPWAEEPRAEHRASIPPWRTEIGLRIRRLLWLKVLGTTAFTWLFFIGYFHTLRHPAYPVLEMPLTWLDRELPFVPWALVPYLSLWFYMGIAPGLMRNFGSLVLYGVWAGALCLTGLALFYAFPTAIPTSQLWAQHAVDLQAHPGFALLHGVDASGNACPSMHVAGAVYTAWWVQRLLRHVQAPAVLRWGNLVWAALIVWSTLAIKQHVWWDVVAGAALGAVFAAAATRWFVPLGQMAPSRPAAGATQAPPAA